MSDAIAQRMVAFGLMIALIFVGMGGCNYMTLKTYSPNLTQDAPASVQPQEKEPEDWRHQLHQGQNWRVSYANTGTPPTQANTL